MLGISPRFNEKGIAHEASFSRDSIHNDPDMQEFNGGAYQEAMSAAAAANPDSLDEIDPAESFTNFLMCGGLIGGSAMNMNKQMNNTVQQPTANTQPGAKPATRPPPFKPVTNLNNTQTTVSSSKGASGVKTEAGATIEAAQAEKNKLQSGGPDADNSGGNPLSAKNLAGDAAAGVVANKFILAGGAMAGLDGGLTLAIAGAVTALSAGTLAVDAATMSVRGNDMEQSSASWDIKPGQEPLTPISTASTHDEFGLTPSISNIIEPSLFGVRGKIAMDKADEHLQQLDQTIAQAKGAMAQIVHREDKGVTVAASEVSPALATNAQNSNPFMIDLERDPVTISGHLA